MQKISLPVGVKLTSDVEYRPDRASPYRARVRWVDPTTKKRISRSEAFSFEEQATAWVIRLERAAARGITPDTATMTLAEYGDVNMDLALRGVEKKTTDPYRAGWKLRVVPTLGHLPITMITNGAVDRAVHVWIAEECSKSTVKNSLAILVRVMEQAVRDEVIDRNPARVTGWQREYRRSEDELDDPRSLALRDWDTLISLADALVEKSADRYRGWGDAVIFEACTATRIGEVSGCRVQDIDTNTWLWNLRRQTTPSPGGMEDKGTKGNRARDIPIIEELRPIVLRRIELAGGESAMPDARLFVGPRGGRITTATLRDATHWDDVVKKLGYEYLTRHGLRHTGLTWMADAGVPVHHLQLIAGHGDLSTTQRYLHPDRRAITDAGELLSKHLRAPHRPAGGSRLRVI